MLHLIRVKPDLHDLVVCSHIYVCIQFLWGLPLFTQLFIHIYSYMFWFWFRENPDLHDLHVCSHIYVCIQFLFTQLFIHIYSCENVILISLILLVIK